MKHNQIISISKFFGLVLLTALINACSIVPEQTDYATAINQQTTRIVPWKNPTDAQAVSTLNNLIAAPSLEPLLNTALQNNPSLQQTLITLNIRQQQLIQAEALQQPFVGAGLSAGNSEGSSSYSTSLSINWQADVWGQLENIEQAAQRDVFSQALLLQSAKDTLAAEVIRNWLTLVSQSRAIAIESQRLDSLQQTETFILQRYRQGLGVLEDLDTARTAVSSSQSRLELLNENLRQQQLFFNALLGQTTAPIALRLPEQYPAVALPLAALPQQTLNRRPDLRAAYSQIEAAQLRTEAAYKDLLPSFNLQAILQDTASSPRAALFGAPVWTLLGQLTAPLYEGGQRKAAAEIAELNTALAYQSYRDLLLTAVTEIEQALSQEQALAKQQQFIEAATRTAENNLLQYQSSYRSGLRSILDLLIIQQQNYDLQAQLDILIFQRLLNRINLALALGLEVST